MGPEPVLRSVPCSLPIGPICTVAHTLEITLPLDSTLVSYRSFLNWRMFQRVLFHARATACQKLSGCTGTPAPLSRFAMHLAMERRLSARESSAFTFGEDGFIQGGQRPHESPQG